jgi:hypothetical protein
MRPDGTKYYAPGLRIRTYKYFFGFGSDLIRSEAVFLNVYGAQESIPRNELRQPR